MTQETSNRQLPAVSLTGLLGGIRAALCDPTAPWYGSDLVPMVADLCDAVEAQQKTFEAIKAFDVSEKLKTGKFVLPHELRQLIQGCVSQNDLNALDAMREGMGW